MKLEVLEDLYKQKLAELYDGEKQLLRFMPKATKAISDPDLKQMFETHLEETKTQAERLISKRGVDISKPSKAMSGVLAETTDLLNQKNADPGILMLAMAATGQDVEGLEIRGYACAHTYARLLGFHEDFKILEQTFEEEKKMEENLVGLTESLGVEEVENETPIDDRKAA